ncbi:MAG TPA: hypothetical protein VFG76_01390 [Candidatus Polarisedimenticolia bacterium]|nr:hypothetical protein [Candidatus Polarisedimenticolia bacterium]
MTSTSHRLLQAFLWMVCVFHVVVGVGLNVSSEFPRLMAGYYGATVDWTPQFTYILKPLGAFMFVLGLLAAAAARDPRRYRGVAYLFATLFTIRALQRLVLSEPLHDAFSISPARNMGNAVFFLVLAATLVGLHLWAQRTSPEAPR